MSPLGRSSSISAVNGSRPAGPAADVLTSHAAPSDPTMASNAISVFICRRGPFIRIATR